MDVGAPVNALHVALHPVDNNCQWYERAEDIWREAEPVDASES